MTNPHFTITGIPERLGARPEGKRRPLTLGELNQIAWRDRQFVLPVVGDCMEAANIVDGGWIAVDTTRRPAPPRYKSKGGDGTEDACLCYATFPGQPVPTVMVKAYLGAWGSSHMVTTRYQLSEDHPYDLAVEALDIFGAVYASWDADGHLLWQRDPSSFPKRLVTEPTIFGGDVVPISLFRRATA